jgi:hypothetical protein
MESSRIMNEDGAASEQGVEVERSYQEIQSTNRKLFWAANKKLS